MLHYCLHRLDKRFNFGNALEVLKLFRLVARKTVDLRRIEDM